MKASECLKAIPCLSAEYIGNDDEVLFSSFSLLQRGIKCEGIYVFFNEIVNVIEVSTLWTSNLHFSIISDIFTIRHLVTQRLGFFRYLFEGFLVWLTMALQKCQKKNNVISLAEVLPWRLGGRLLVRILMCGFVFCCFCCC